MIKLTLTGNPLSTQNIYKYFCRGNFGRFYMTREGKATKERYKVEIAEQYEGSPVGSNLVASVNLYFKDKRRRDVDNYNKILLDSMEGLIYDDDKQIKQ